MTDRPKVCVLTGDPRLPDLTKRDHRYNDEDFATHRAMREAFESLPGYRFAFLDDHATLFERFDAETAAYRQFEAMYIEAIRQQVRARYARPRAERVITLELEVGR